MDHKTTIENPRAAMMPVPTIGRAVHYVLPSGPYAGKHRPAVITEVWNGMEHPQHPGMSNLTIFASQPRNDMPGQDGAAIMVGSVSHDASGTPGTWHWPEGTREAQQAEMALRA